MAQIMKRFILFWLAAVLAVSPLLGQDQVQDQGSGTNTVAGATQVAEWRSGKSGWKLSASE
jgi:hypothetical protein